MSIAPAWQQCLAFFGSPLVIEPSPGQLSSDAGLLPIRQFDQRMGLTQAYIDTLGAARDCRLYLHLAVLPCGCGWVSSCICRRSIRRSIGCRTPARIESGHELSVDRPRARRGADDAIRYLPFRQ
jgi:hypothetical protein